MAEQDREGDVFSEEAASTTIRAVAWTVKPKQKYLFQTGHRAPVQRLTNLKKNIIPEGCTQGKFG